MTTREILQRAVDMYLVGDTPAMEVLIARYEEKRGDGGFVPGIEINGDVLKDLLVDLINTKEALVQNTMVQG